MHFQTVFGVDVFDRISAKEYERWKVYFDILGPIWWKRNDWNFASLESMISGSVYEKRANVNECLIKFKRVKHDPLANTIAMISAFGCLNAEQIDELRYAMQIDKGQ